jgi:hypothetical protein
VWLLDLDLVSWLKVHQPTRGYGMSKVGFSGRLLEIENS